MYIHFDFNDKPCSILFFLYSKNIIHILKYSFIFLTRNELKYGRLTASTAAATLPPPQIDEITRQELLREIKHSKKILAKNPTDTLTVTNYGRNICALDRAQEAIDLYDRALQQTHAHNATIIVHKGDVYLELKNYAQAMKCFDSELSFNKQSTHAYTSKGKLYAEQGDWERAIVCFNIAISIDPSWRDALEQRINLLAKKTELDDLTLSTRFNKLNVRQETKNFSFYAKAFIFLTNNRLAEALTCLDKCLTNKEKKEDFINAHIAKAITLGKMSRHQEANDTLIAICLDEKVDENLLAKAHLLKGEANLEMKKYEKAIESFEQAIKLNFSNPELHESYGSYLFHLGR